MSWQELYARYPELDRQRVAQLGITTVEELAVMAQSDPATFAHFFGLKNDPAALIASLVASLSLPIRTLLDSRETKVDYPINGVPVHRWSPKAGRIPDAREISERDRLVREIAALRSRSETGLPSAEIHRQLADRVAALRAMFQGRQRWR